MKHSATTIAGVLALMAGAIGAPALAENAGQAAYTADCSGCHQTNGQGIKGAFPALAGDTLVTGDPAGVIRLVLKGRGAMPSFAADLGDAEVAAVVSYIRSSWGNTAHPVTPADVAAVRAAP